MADAVTGKQSRPPRLGVTGAYRCGVPDASGEPCGQPIGNRAYLGESHARTWRRERDTQRKRDKRRPPPLFYSANGAWVSLDHAQRLRKIATALKADADDFHKDLREHFGAQDPDTVRRIAHYTVVVEALLLLLPAERG